MAKEELRQRKRGREKSLKQGLRGNRRRENWSKNWRLRDRSLKSILKRGVYWMFKTHSYFWHFLKRQKRFDLVPILFFCRSEPEPRLDHVRPWVYIG